MSFYLKTFFKLEQNITRLWWLPPKQRIERWLLFKINALKEKEILTTENEEVKTLQSTQGFEIQATSLTPHWFIGP